MIKYIFFILLFIISKSYSLEIQCKFEEVYSNSSVQNGFFLIKDQKLRYQYYSKDLFTIFQNDNRFYLLKNNDTSIVQRLNQNTELLKELMLILSQYPNLKKYENSGKPFHTLDEFENTKNYKNYPFFTGHLPIYITSIDLFLDKPFIGGGIKSFRNQCSKKIHLPNRVCENHPHNYVLEILNDTGLLGFLLIHYLVIFLLFNNYKDYKISEKLNSKISNWI